MSCVLIAYPTTEAESLISRYNARCDSDGAEASTQSTCALDAILALFGEQSAYVLDCDEIEVSLTLSVQDIQDVTKRRGSFSKTINLAGTPANNVAFSHAYNIQSFVGGFTPNKKVRCALWDNGIQTFTGVLQLLSITKAEDQINYEVALFSEESAFFRQINETKLVDTAGIAAFNHTLSASLASGTWVATAGSGYVYGFVDGIGYTDVQPNALSFFGASLAVSFLQLTPSFYIKQLVDLIFAQSGYRYSSAFFESERFKKLVLPYAAGSFLQNDLSNQNSQVETATALTAIEANYPIVESGAYRFPNGVSLNYNRFNGIIPFDTAVTDPQTYWDLTDHYLQNVAYYTSWDVSYELTIENVKGSQIDFLIAVCDRATGQPINIPLYNIQNALDLEFISGTLRGLETRKFSFQGTVRLAPNQEMDVRIFYLQLEGIEDPYPLEVKNEAQLTMICTENVVANLDVDMRTALPTDITQADLLSDLQKMFNLYFYQAPEDPNLIYIEPFKDFYTSGSVDWSSKIDQSEPHQITMGDPEKRKAITFKYRDSGDALGKLYADTFPEGYGARQWQTDNYYAKGEQVVQTKCATVIPASYGTGLVIGRTFDIDSNGLPKAKANGYRIAQFNYISLPDGSPWLYLNDLTPIFTAFFNLPFISHIDNPYAPTFDLAFGIPKTLYYIAPDGNSYADYDNRNLFNTYWRNYIIETTSKESLQIEVPLILSVADIYALDFRKPVYIDGILFRIIEIRDYVVGGQSKCTAVLRRILNLEEPTLGAIPTLTYFDTFTTVLGETRPKAIEPNKVL